jgi:hypothetical protein
MLGVPTTPAIVTNTSQTIRISGPQGATARLLQTENALFVGGVPNDGFDIDPFETNKVISVLHRTVTIGASGFVDVPVVLTDSHERAGVNTFVAAIQDLDGRTSLVSNFIVVALNDDPASNPDDVTGLLAGDYDGTGTVDNWDYACWKMAYGDTGDGLLADGNGNGVVDAADYVLWRKKLGTSLPPGAGATVGSQVQSGEAAAVAVSFNNAPSTTTNQGLSAERVSASDVVVEKLNRRSIGSSKRLGSATRLERSAPSKVTNLELLTLAESLAVQASRHQTLSLSDADVDRERPELQRSDALELAFELIGARRDFPFERL